MENTPSTFDKENKIRRVDLAESFQEDLNQGLLTPEERERIENIIAGGSAQLGHKLTINIQDQDPVVFDGASDKEVNLDPDSLGMAEKDHNHDGTYSKLDHEHNYAGADIPGGPANSAKKLENALEIVSDEGTANYDGSSPVSIKIKSRAAIQLSKKDFPNMGDINTLYVDKDTGIGYLFDENTRLYYSVGFGNDKLKTISANKNSLSVVNINSIEFDHIILTAKIESEWLGIDPVLLRGELALVLDRDGNYKIGDGIKKFSELPYACIAPSGNGTEVDDSKIPK